MQQTRVTLYGLELIDRSMLTAANLVTNFKQMAQKHRRHERPAFELATWSRLRLKLLAERAEQAGHVVDIDIPPGIQLDSYPDQLGQVLDILVGKGLPHDLQPAGPVASASARS